MSVRHPELLVEPRLESGRPVTPERGPGRVVGESRQQLGARDGRRVAVALHLDQGDRAVGDPSVGEADRVARVFPALVGQAVPRGVVVLGEAVAVGVGVVAQPGQRAVQAVHQALGHRVDAGRDRVGQQQHPQRGRVDRAVVLGRQHGALLQVERGGPHLVQDLARLFGPIDVDGGALAAGQRAQGADRHLGVGRQQQPCRDQRVTAEQGEKPRGAGGEEGAVGLVAFAQPQAAEVGQRLGDQPRQRRRRVRQRRRCQWRGSTAHERRRRVAERQAPVRRYLPEGGQGQPPAQGDRLVVLDRGRRRVERGRRSRAESPAVPLQRHRSSSLDAGLDQVQRGVVGHQPEGEGHLDRPRQRGGDHDALAEPAGVGHPVAGQRAERVGGAVLPAHDGVKVDRSVRSQRRSRGREFDGTLGVLHVDAQPSQHPMVTEESALHTRAVNIAVGRRPHLGGRSEHHGEIVQERLAKGHGFTPPVKGRPSRWHSGTGAKHHSWLRPPTAVTHSPQHRCAHDSAASPLRLRALSGTMREGPQQSRHHCRSSTLGADRLCLPCGRWHDDEGERR